MQLLLYRETSYIYTNITYTKGFVQKAKNTGGGTHPPVSKQNINLHVHTSLPVKTQETQTTESLSQTFILY